jgi:CMP-N-acetylneuraminic acid synthetase/quercetin dioxygenase-like cupin family protein
MKVVGMIPARLGSKRVKNKNLRLINGKPLIEYVLETIKKLDKFDEVYINSEDEIFSGIAEKYSFKFYKRSPHLSTDKATNDEFAYDFLKNVECDVLVQILPTSPLLNEEEINRFVDHMVQKSLDTLISVEHKQIACIYENKPINFDKLVVNPPSQTMVPIRAYATVLMGWTSSSFKANMDSFGVGYHGGEGKIDYFELKGLSTIDIDTEDDFRLVESIILSSAYASKKDPEYYSEVQEINHEVDVPSILAKDGVKNNDLFDANKEVVNLNDLIVNMDSDASWSKRVIDTESNSMTVISQIPGEGNRRHHHPDWNEWWYIVAGEWDWEIEGKIRKVKKGDIVFMEKNRVHKITASGFEPAIRMAVSRSDVVHVYKNRP